MAQGQWPAQANPFPIRRTPAPRDPSQWTAHQWFPATTHPVKSHFNNPSSRLRSHQRREEPLWCGPLHGGKAFVGKCCSAPTGSSAWGKTVFPGAHGGEGDLPQSGRTRFSTLRVRTHNMRNDPLTREGPPKRAPGGDG